jgi:hypothetical protein
MASPTDLQQRAIEFAKLGDFGPQALAVNLELSKIAPTNEGAWTRLSRCYLEGGQLDEATGALDAVLMLNPQNMIARSLQVEVQKRRMARSGPVVTPRTRTPKAERAERVKVPSIAGFARGDFGMLGRLSPEAAVESVGPRVEALLMALNDRPFAAKAVETRNRAGQSGARLFRRNTVAGGPGILSVYHQGGRWEPQLNIAFQSATVWGRDAVRAGIGFQIAPDETPDEYGQERALEYFAEFQKLLAGTWRSFLTEWMGGNGGFIQHGTQPPSTELLPKDAITWLINCQQPLDVGWVFYGRWLFADRSKDADTVADARQLVTWIERSFTDLLPLWSSLYRA